MQRGGGEDRRIAHLPGRRPARRRKLRLHEKARGLLVSPPAGEPRAGQRAAVTGARLCLGVALVHEAAADGTRPGVQVLVAAPHREVGVRVVQRERHVADRVREVEAGDAAVRVRGARDARQVKHLPGAILHPGPQHQRDLSAVRGEARLDVRFRHGVFAGARGELEQRALRVEAVPGDLRGHRVPVRGEGAGLDEDAAALTGRTVEARQHQVQVHGERVHRHHFIRLRAGEGGEPCGCGSRGTASTGGAHARAPRRRAAPSHRAPAR